MKPTTGCLIRALNIYTVLAAANIAPSSWGLTDISLMTRPASHSNYCQESSSPMPDTEVGFLLENTSPYLPFL